MGGGRGKIGGPLYQKLDKKTTGKIIKRLSLGAGSVIVLMSLYKTLAVFLYSSYEEAVNSSNLGLTDFVFQLDSYFLGMKTVARNVTFSSVNSVGLSNALYDIFRNIQC